MDARFNVNFEDLKEFIKHKMSMTHIYQPLMIKTLLESKDNIATTEQIARSFLVNSVTELEYYKKITGRWPRQTLRNHGIISYAKDRYTLLLDENVTDAQRRMLIELCELKFEEFIEKDPWIRTARNKDERTASDSLRYATLAKSGGKCTLCGIDSFKRSLDVDHILPRSMGGETVANNLQALCYKCNRAKRNRDAVDYMRIKKRMQFRRKDCRLCDPRPIVASNELTCAVYGESNKTGEVSALVIPKRHVSRISDMISPERFLCFDLVYEVQSMMMGGDKRITNFHTSFESNCPGHYSINVMASRQ